MQVLVMFSQYRAFVYAQSLKYKLRLYLKEIMYFSPDTNVFQFHRFPTAIICMFYISADLLSLRA
jgi:hypothetical protein